MKYVVLSIFDRASGIYGRPVFVPAKGAGIRSFTDEINRADPQNEIYRHPDDYDLYDLGSFDDQSGAFELNVSPSILVRGKDVVVKE